MIVNDEVLHKGRKDLPIRKKFVGQNIRKLEQEVTSIDSFPHFVSVLLAGEN